MPAKKFLYLLSRDEVKEVALAAGQPAKVLINDAYRRTDVQPLTDDALIALLAAVGGMPHLPGLADGRSWDYDSGTSIIRVTAGYDGSVLKVTLRRTAVKPQASDSLTPPPKPPRASRRPPAAATASPARASRRPPVRAEVTAPTDPAPKPQRSSKRPVTVNFSDAPAAPQPAAAREAPIPSPFPTADADAASARSLAREAANAAHVVTGLHDVFNFEESTGWTDGSPFAQAPAVQKPVIPKFEGDLLDDLLGKARERQATDLHLLADRPPTLRIAGELVPLDFLVDAARAEALVLARVPERARTSLDRDGSCDFSLIHPAYGRFRANVTRQRSGIKLTARPIRAKVPTLAELGLPESIAKATHHHQGLIVIAGPTGHGKTTTLAAIVGIINRETTHHVITVEDPIEHVHPTAKAVVSQREVGTHTKTFQAALKGSLREDPDVIVVGELRDTETVRMALSASETGHLVITTMNTPSAAKAIDRLIDLFPPGDQPQVRMTLAGGLRLIVAQRLLPNADRTGLVAAAEVLPGNLPLWNLIRENRTYQIASLQQRGKTLGIVRLDESLAQLVRAGKTTLEIAKGYAEQPEYFEALVAGRPIIARPDDGQAKQPRAQAAAAVAKAAAPAAAAAAAAVAPAKKAAVMGKSMLNRAGRLFGADDS